MIKTKEEIHIKYLELFAGTGIGGIPLDELGFESIGYSEYDKDVIYQNKYRRL